MNSSPSNFPHVIILPLVYFHIPATPKKQSSRFCTRMVVLLNFASDRRFGLVDGVGGGYSSTRTWGDSKTSTPPHPQDLVPWPQYKYCAVVLRIVPSSCLCRDYIIGKLIQPLITALYEACRSYGV